MSSSFKQLSVAIVGAGPAGVLVAAEAAIKGHLVTWIDNQQFQSGLLQQYLDVPSNTKLQHLTELGLFDTPIKELAERHPSVQEALHQVFDNALPSPPHLAAVDPSPNSNQAWPRLGDMQQLFQSCSTVLSTLPNVTTIDGRALLLARKNNKWHISTNAAAAVIPSTDAVVLCCGGQPRVVSEFADFDNAVLVPLRPDALEPLVLNQVDALNPTVLSSTLTKLKPKAIALIGNSHTAALVARNLQVLGYDRQTVTVYCHQPMQLAEWIPDLFNYKYTATGLKGLAAAYAMEEDGEDTEGPMSDAHIQLIDRNASYIDQDFLLKHDVVIPCVGFVPAAHPQIRINNSVCSVVDDEGTAGNTDDNEWTPTLLKYDAATSAINARENIYELGMSRPEYFTTYPEEKYPTPAIHGGDETNRVGWKDQRLVSWSSFRLRAKQIVANMEEHDERINNGGKA